MAPISDSLRASLDNFNHQIEAAEKALRKLPGSRSDNANLPVDWILDDPEAFMRFGCKDFRDRIVVQEFDSYKTIDDHAIDIQIDLANQIPDLLALARASEEEIRCAVDEAADAIEHALTGNVIAKEPATDLDQNAIRSGIFLNPEVTPRLSDKAFAILGVLTTSLMPRAQIMDLAGVSSEDITCQCGATDPEKRAQWEGGKNSSTGYHATDPRSDIGGWSLLGLGYVESAKEKFNGRRVDHFRITSAGMTALADEAKRRANDCNLDAGAGA